MYASLFVCILSSSFLMNGAVALNNGYICLFVNLSVSMFGLIANVAVALLVCLYVFICLFYFFKFFQA